MARATARRPPRRSPLQLRPPRAVLEELPDHVGGGEFLAGFADGAFGQIQGTAGPGVAAALDQIELGLQAAGAVGVFVNLDRRAVARIGVLGCGRRSTEGRRPGGGK